jgi:3D (Asp-Asp-Asp) domain-containing protein
MKILRRTDLPMRRSALHFGIPVVCALLGVMLIGASGRADDTDRLPELALAASSTPGQSAAPPRMLPTTRPIDSLNELLVSAAPVKVRPAPPQGSIRGPRVVMMEVTAYCPCKKCCGPKARGITASGKRVDHNDGLFVAADKAMFDFHTKLRVPGYAGGRAVPVLDRGGAIKGSKLDVFFPSHAEALQWGRQMIAVTVAD